MRILVLSSLVKSTGNTTTAEKLAGYLSPKHEVFLKNIHEETFEALAAFVRQNAIEVALGVHALLGGPFLHALGIPYVLILAGTDIYQPVHALYEKQKQQVIDAAAQVVTYTESHLHTAWRLWPSTRTKGQAIFKTIDVSTRDKSFSIRHFLGLTDDAHLILLPSGIRAIKDPFHVLDGLEAFRQSFSPKSILAVVGPVLEEEYGRQLIAKLHALPGARCGDALPREQMLAAIASADVVINTSIGEGASNALLEAMALGTPVVARKNDGNLAVVEDGVTGWIYTEPEDFWRTMQSLIADREETRRRVAAALALGQSRQTKALEFTAYEAALTKAIKRGV